MIDRKGEKPYHPVFKQDFSSQFTCIWTLHSRQSDIFAERRGEILEIKRSSSYRW